MGPKRKEEKETVVYPASKRKAAPFKPLRPSKAPRTGSTDSASVPRIGSSETVVEVDDDSDDMTNKATHNEADDRLLNTDDDDDEDDYELPEPTALPLKAKSKPNPSNAKAGTWKRAAGKDAARAASAGPSLSGSGSDADEGGPTAPAQHQTDGPPIPSQSDSIPSIPQALLVRLLHEHFTDESTRIDKHAVQILQKYMEVFVRETIERARLAKRQAVEDGKARPEDEGFLDLEDLEKVAPGVMLDF